MNGRAHDLFCVSRRAAKRVEFNWFLQPEVFMRRRSSSRAGALIAAATVVCGISSGAVAQNLFTNPGFESGDLAGWQLDPAAGWIVGNDGMPLPPSSEAVNVRSGAYAVAGGSTRFPGLTQTVAVEPNTLYEIGGWVSLDPSTANSNWVGHLTIWDGMTNLARLDLRAAIGTTAQDFARFRRFLRTEPGQTSVSISYDALLAQRPSWDDFYMIPATAVPASPTATRHLLGTGELPPQPEGGAYVVGAPTFPTLNNAGQALMSARTRQTAYPDYVVVQDDPTAGLSVPLRTGSPVVGPGGGTGSLNSVYSVHLNDDGDIAVNGSWNPPTGGHAEALFRHEGGGATSVVVASGEAVPEGNGRFESIEQSTPPQISSSGVAFRAQLADTAPGFGDETGLYYRPEGGAVMTVARAGQPAPGGGTMSGAYSFALNNNGTIAFVSAIQGLQFTQVPGLFVYEGGTLQRVAAYASGTSVSPTPALNDMGDIAIALRSASGPPNRIDLRRDGQYATLLSSGQPAPGAGAATFTVFGDPAINNAAQVAFAATLSDGTSGIFRADGSGNVVPIVRSTQVRPDGTGTFHRFVRSRDTGLQPERPAINAGGQVAFVNFPELAPDEATIYLADPSEVVQVARWGEEVEGGTITDFPWVQDSDLELNDFGQIAYSAILADGRTVNRLFTPTLQWRSDASGNWSESDNWTVGLSPAHVHPVVINSPDNLTVTLPPGQTSVKSLEVGAGNTLALAGSDLTVTEGVTIAGTLSGSGTITGDVDLPGRLELELAGEQFDRLVVTGNLDLTGGDVFVLGAGDLGQSYELITAGGITGTPTWHLPGESTLQFIDLPGGGQAVQMTYVPEPASAAAVAAALGLLSAGRRRRRGS